MHVVSSYANGMLQEVNDELLKGMVLCNDASISQNEVLGEPTETALLCFGEKQGFHKKDLDMKYVRVNEIPFDSNRKRMTTIHQHEREVVAYTKGALEKILAMCTSVWQDGKAVRMSNYEKQRILEASRQVSEDAQRVLALARKTLKSPYEDDVENKMCFIGFVGLMDPPREEVKDAIARCYKAGIRVAMITGDHPLTALAIARRLGIAKQETEVITGNQLDAMSDEELCASVKGYRVFARVTPQHKVRLSLIHI